MIDRVALALTAALWILPASAQTASGSIEGQILNLKTGAPLRDATVVLSGPYAKEALDPDERSLPTLARVSSGDQGRFAFHDLAAGNYLIGAAHAGFRGGGFSENLVVRELLPVGEGQQMKDVVLKLAPLGVIACKVVDEAGHPLLNARITTYRYSSGMWMRAGQAGESGMFGYTNDLGEYRAVLPPGPFVVSAAYPFALAQLEPDLTPGLGHPTTYYPGAASPENAQPLTVVSGETVKADFTLRKAPAYRISGFLTGPDGKRVWSQACPGILPKGSVPTNFLLLGSISTTPQDGSFAIVEIPPGSYLLTGALCGNEPYVSGVQDLEVSGNVEGLKLRVTPARQLRATLKLEGDANLTGATVYLLHRGWFPDRVPTAEISNGRSLVFDGVLSLPHVVEIRRLPLNCYVKSVRYGGQEVTAAGFQPVEGASLEITVSTLVAAQLTGSVADAAGRPVRYPLVTLMPSDGGPASSAKSVIGDADGKFVFTALRPGEYRAAAWGEYFSVAQLGEDSRILRLYAERGKVVTVEPGTPPTVALTLVAAGEMRQARSKP